MTVLSNVFETEATISKFILVEIVFDVKFDKSKTTKEILIKLKANEIGPFLL